MNPFERVCLDCIENRERDNGPPCPACKGTGVVLDRAAINRRIAGLQTTMSYAAPELLPHLREQIAILFDLLD